MFSRYYALAKPGIVYGNILTTLAAFLYASRLEIRTAPFLGVLLGMALVIASACVLNNYLDRDIDAKMERTKMRALVTGAISPGAALVYAACLGLAGFTLLLVCVNALTAVVAATGFLFYLLYDFAKRRTPAGTLVGSVSGAVPILAGYTAAAGRIDTPALILFCILVCWQMPHFYAIAIRRMDEYAAAHIPVLPLAKGIEATRRSALFFILAYMLAASTLTFTGDAGYVYLVVVVMTGARWFWVSVRGDARASFLTSLGVLVSFSVVLSVARILP